MRKKRIKPVNETNQKKNMNDMLHIFKCNNECYILNFHNHLETFLPEISLGHCILFSLVEETKFNKITSPWF